MSGWPGIRGGIRRWLIAARDATGYVGAGVLAAVLAGPVVGAMLPVAYVFLVVLLGNGRAEGRLVQWPFADFGSASALAMAVLLEVGPVPVLSGRGGWAISALAPPGRRR
jgi:hypothetical protein